MNLLRLLVNLEYEDVLRELHASIGCEGLHQQCLPEIACLLSKDVKAHKFALDAKGWEHLKVEWCVEVEKKRNACVADIILPTDISSLNLFVPNTTNSPPQFLKELALAKKHKKRKAPASSKKGGKVTSKKISFKSDSESTGGAATDIDYTPEYQKTEDNLMVELRCALCQKKDPERLCLLDKYGKHRIVTREMLRTWVTAIVSSC